LALYLDEGLAIFFCFFSKKMKTSHLVSYMDEGFTLASYFDEGFTLDFVLG
jgi:hypothetical protein